MLSAVVDSLLSKSKLWSELLRRWHRLVMVSTTILLPLEGILRMVIPRRWRETMSGYDRLLSSLKTVLKLSPMASM